MITFVRHGHKAFANGKGKPRFDPNLVEEFLGLPSHDIYHGKEGVVVYSSPYRRCQQTAKKFSNDYIVDCRLGEYLGHWTYKNVRKETDFHPDTLTSIQAGCSLPPPEESIPEMKNRMLSFLKDLVKDFLDTPTEKRPDHIIVVSHGLPIEILQRSLTSTKRTFSSGKKLPPGYIEGFSIRLEEKDVIPTRYYDDTNRSWCDSYGYDSSLPLSKDICDSFGL